MQKVRTYLMNSAACTFSFFFWLQWNTFKRQGRKETIIQIARPIQYPTFLKALFDLEFIQTRKPVSSQSMRPL